MGSAIPAMGAATMLAGLVGYGSRLKQLMKAGLLHARTAGSQPIHQDLPQCAPSGGIARGSRNEV